MLLMHKLMNSSTDSEMGSGSVYGMVSARYNSVLHSQLTQDKKVMSVLNVFILVLKY